MGKIRYYCDYCDRSFLDDLKARKRHLSGTQHNRLKRQYYLPLREAKEAFAEERLKVSCRKFLVYNECPFGDNCRYSHYTPQELEILRSQVEEAERNASKFLTFESLQDAMTKMPSSESVKNWLNIWESKKNACDAKPIKPALKVVSQALLSWDLPSTVTSCYNLPPSLQTWKLPDIENIQLTDWG